MTVPSHGRRLRLLHFALDSDTSGYFPQLARWRDRDSVDMTFGTLRATDERLAARMREYDVSTWSCGARSPAEYPMATLRLARLLRRERIDVLHAHLYHPSLVGLLAAALVRTPLRVQTRHYSDYHTRIGRRGHVMLDRLCARLSHAVIAVSQHTAEHLVQVEGIPAAKVHVVLNGIDFERVRPSSPDAAARARAELVRPGELMLLTVGRLHPEKGYDQLFQALSGALRRTTVPVRLLVAGTGPFDGIYRERVRALGLSDHVQLLGFRQDIPDLLAAADLFVLPSLAEAFGLAVAEALYMGTPVLATRCGGIPEIVDNGRDGVLVPPGDVGALTEALVSLINDGNRRHALAGVGRTKVRERFDFERTIRSHEALYARLLGA